MKVGQSIRDIARRRRLVGGVDNLHQHGQNVLRALVLAHRRHHMLVFLFRVFQAQLLHHRVQRRFLLALLFDVARQSNVARSHHGRLHRQHQVVETKLARILANTFARLSQGAMLVAEALAILRANRDAYRQQQREIAVVRATHAAQTEIVDALPLRQLALHAARVLRVGLFELRQSLHIRLQLLLHFANADVELGQHVLLALAARQPMQHCAPILIHLLR
mmetsp:Transcript_1321/g.2595  ORF Transcript_1321/g.2595 Transcript_1321/m.2595 type:complete len:221 (+) Transcript_1321:735-1397(+)